MERFALSQGDEARIIEHIEAYFHTTLLTAETDEGRISELLVAAAERWHALAEGF